MKLTNEASKSCAEWLPTATQIFFTGSAVLQGSDLQVNSLCRPHRGSVI